MTKKKVLVFYPRYSKVYRELLEKHIPEAEFLICQSREEVEKSASDVEIAFVPRNFPLCGPSLPEDMVECFKENFRRSLKKEPLLGRIDFERGF